MFDLSTLPPPQSIEEIDFEAILEAMKEDLVALYPAIEPTLALESAVVNQVMQVASYREVMMRARVNDALRANLLAFATGGDLDQLAAFYDAARMAGESDERFRLRTVLAIQGRSTGGTEPRYRAVALGASDRVADAAVYRVDSTPRIQIAVTATDNNGVADAGLLALVLAAVTAPAVRMVNDTIEVVAAVTEAVDVAAQVWLLPDAAGTLIQDLVPALRADWASEAGLGFDLTPEWLIGRLMKPGVQRVSIVAPGRIVVPPYRALALGQIDLQLMGRDR